MGKLSAFRIKGLTLSFNSLDHKPPHFHVRSGDDWEIKVNIQDSTEKRGLVFQYKFPKRRSSKFEGLSSKLEKELLAKVLEHKLALLAEWQDKVDQKEII